MLIQIEMCRVCVIWVWPVSASCLCWSVTPLSTNQRPVSRSCDHCPPIRGQCQARVYVGLSLLCHLSRVSEARHTVVTQDHYSGLRARHVPEMFLIVARSSEMSLVADRSISQGSLIVTAPISSDVISVQLYLANYFLKYSDD